MRERRTIHYTLVQFLKCVTTYSMNKNKYLCSFFRTYSTFRVIKWGAQQLITKDALTVLGHLNLLSAKCLKADVCPWEKIIFLITFKNLQQKYAILLSPTGFSWIELLYLAKIVIIILLYTMYLLPWCTMVLKGEDERVGRGLEGHLINSYDYVLKGEGCWERDLKRFNSSFKCFIYFCMLHKLGSQTF